MRICCPRPGPACHAAYAAALAIARPPLAVDRLKLSFDARVRYEFRRPWRDGTTHVVFEPLVFLERLAALVPPPRMQMPTYHGVLAPGASWRDDVVPKVARSPSTYGEGAPPEQDSEVVPRPPHRYLWAELMRRVFGLDVLLCRKCRTHRRLIALITERPVIVAILAHLGLDADPPPIHPARAPPQPEFAF